MNSKTLDYLVGKPVFSFLVALCTHNPDISALRFGTYDPIEGLWDRLKKRSLAANHEIGEQAEAMADNSLLPAWNHFAHLALKAGFALERCVVDAVVDQLSNPVPIVEVGREEILGSTATEIIARFPSGHGVVLRSNVVTKAGDLLRIPMMDFLSKTSDSSASTIATFVRVAGLAPAVIVNSGRSYHFYGIRLLTEPQWLQFLAKSLLFSPITDSRYIGHRLFEMECTLKVRSKNGEIPQIVDVVS